MRYLLLIYTQEPTEAPSPEAIADEMEAYNAFTREIRDRGAMLGGEALHPTTAATTVRVRDGQTVATDGPFAETKEALGGYYLIDARDLDEAIELAAKIPGARHGSIEIRPIFEFGEDKMGAGGSGAAEAAGVAG
ncbi:MAG TPA: YciI family protein [Candidatus Limnocylindrales bacterium]|nr:YciI family protein [Candidatus Limnocylindrales bacterium]